VLSKIVLFLHHQKTTTMSRTFLLEDNTTLEVIQDDDAQDPREAWEPMGTMICFHKRYSLGDKHTYTADDFANWEDMKKKLTRKLNIAVILPLYLYDHSGITMSTKPFGDPWDSGQVGFIYVTKTTVRNEYKVSRMSKKIIEKVTKCLLAEVETYDQFISGEVYGFKHYDAEGEEIESVWGFYGYDPKENGMLDGKAKIVKEL
jgi:hypothetical protein